VGSTEVLPALSHQQKAMDLDHSVQLSFLCISLQLYVVFSFGCVQFTIITCQYPIIGFCILSYNNFFAKGHACGFQLHPSDNLSPKGKTDLHSNIVWYDIKYVTGHIEEISVLWMCFSLLVPPVGIIWQPKGTVKPNQVGVVVITIWINLPPSCW